MYRHELKYFINPHQKQVMAGKLSKLCRPDPFSDADGGYVVSSLYFDDYTQSAVFDKLSGVMERKKFRLRVYNYNPDVIKLERKIKRGMLTQKDNLQLSKQEYDALVGGEVDFLRLKQDALANDFYLYYRTRHLRPELVVEYRREAFIYDYGDVRITFDYLLRAGVFQRDLFSGGYKIPAHPPEQIILEVKFTGYFPDVVRNIVQIDNLQWQSSSKYVKCFVVGM